MVVGLDRARLVVLVKRHAEYYAESDGFDLSFEALVARVLADFADPKIPEPVDLIFTSNTYHHIEERVAYFQRAARYLKPTGRLAVLEYKKHGFFQRFLGHATEDDTIVSELEQAGYTLLKKHEFIEQQSFLVFDRR